MSVPFAQSRIQSAQSITYPVINLHLTYPTYAHKLIRFAPNGHTHRLRFHLTPGTSLLNDPKVHLRTNYPVNQGVFCRTEFVSIAFSYDLVHDAVAELDVIHPGAFEFYVQYTDASIEHRSESTYVLIEPSLYINKTMLPCLDAISLITVVPKWLGPFQNWSLHFDTLARLKYNYIHFVPLQKRGSSNSPYSIYDQLDLDNDLFAEIPNSVNDRWAMLANHVAQLQSKYNMLSMTDVVWNHTACNSPWLREHPESGYNLVNSPHLIPAYQLDQAILDFSESIYKNHSSTSPAANPVTEDDMLQLLQIFRNDQFTKIALWEYYVVDVESTLARIKDTWHHYSPNQPDTNPFVGLALMPLPARAQLFKQYAIQEKPFGSRFPYTIITDTCLIYLQTWSLEQQSNLSKELLDSLSKSSQSSLAVTEISFNPDIESELRVVLNEVNLALYKKYDQDVEAIFTNLANTVRWQRLSPDGPQLGPITLETPLVWSYFTRGFTSEYSPELVWANNGWIWGANPLVDFAGPLSNVYLRREVIVWGDCVKLRFGQSPSDSPFVWDHMAEYTRLMAKHFHGFRIDNCHSTPLHVAQYLLDVARLVRPNLYVIAELFTGNAEVDCMFVAKLGINSLIREAMQCWDPRELSRVVHRYSGDPVGSFGKAHHPLTGCLTCSSQVLGNYSSEPHALFMDCTHDNEPPAQKRTVQDTVPNSAIVAMTCCASGSVMGIDWCICENLNIVTETRHYPTFTDDDVGLFAFRKVLNELHYRISRDNLSELYVYQENDFVIVNRQDGRFHCGVLVISRTAFKCNAIPTSLSPVILKKTKVKLITAQGIEPTELNNEQRGSLKDFIPYIPVKLEDRSSLISINLDHNGNTTITVDPATPPGTVFLLETWVTCKDQLSILHELETPKGMEDIIKLCSNLTLHDISVLLFQSSNEEEEFGLGAYVVPGHGALPYAGLEGIATLLRVVIEHNDLGSPLCSNLREGTWLMDYCVNRLEKAMECGRGGSALRQVTNWMHVQFQLVKLCPSYLHPKYFSFVLMALVFAARNSAFNQMNEFVSKGSTFVKQLALTSLALTNSVPSASLFPNKSVISLAAGLPHFSSNHMRCWGRDIFISIKGLYLLTGQYDLAASHIVAFASAMRHGLIPNLLDSGRYPRYNARDATWFWLQAIQDYCNLSPEGNGFLKQKVPRRFPTDTWIHWDDPTSYQKQSTIMELILETLQQHANGIHFREWNAGPALDHAMKSEGFNVDAYIDWKSGLVFGGNAFNCGTWMDKMGDSVKAGNAGFPATPRDGAAIELQGLLANCLKWLANLFKKGIIVDSGIEVGPPLNCAVSWDDWYKLVHKSFERHFYIPSVENQKQFEEKRGMLDSSLINWRGIYKDVYGSLCSKSNYQFRPNQFIAMAVAPHLFTASNAREAIKLGMDILCGPLGMSTLDPKDPDYRGDYDNSNNSHDRHVASGWNYHQGPEWLFPVGLFLQAYLHFASSENHDPRITSSNLYALLQTTQSRLLKHCSHIKLSPWAGLPELTNSNGTECHGSCPIQAWSSATILDLSYSMFLLNNQTNSKN